MAREGSRFAFAGADRAARRASGPEVTVMMNWFQKLLPREDKFFDLFESHARTLAAGADALRRFLDGGEGAARFGKIVVEKEIEADRIAQEVMQSVRRTFITPFDRSDIQQLISSLDDAIDQMQKTRRRSAVRVAPSSRKCADWATSSCRRRS